jgi:hypothetical protein
VVPSFLKQQLHGGLPEPVDAEMLRRENEELQKRIRELETKVTELTAALAKHEGDTAQVHVYIIYLRLMKVTWLYDISPE